MMRALDTDGDGTVSAEELARAGETLKALDKNKDGKLSEDELEPAFPGPGFAGGPGGGLPGRGPGAWRTIADANIDQVMAYDKNKDGKLTKDEVPEEYVTVIQYADTDKDGAVTREELVAMAQADPADGQGPGAGPPPGVGPGGPGGPGGAGAAGRGPRGGAGGAGGAGGGRQNGGRRNVSPVNGRGGPGPGGPGQGGPGQRGPGNPEMFVNHAMQFDANGDGKLDKQELAKFAQQVGRGPGGPGGPGGAGGPGGGPPGNRVGPPSRQPGQ